ncbi:hypothetical protein [Eubacterium aggregans]|uniref:ATP-binding protein n=1 Tax=Eubacterium aggregans TaxID=81409 RepID=A0A1H4EFS0_9FIRM|nr:hypothetical protein [Eubacterium aggregans]MDD4692298.1 hypothetical protein [Eubacterium aggregans]SEA83558.1 hypothetical protein SAMN04515656_1405 [Eubacterium aggregans]
MWGIVLLGNIFAYGMCAGYMNAGMTPRLGKKATGIMWLFWAIGTFLIGQSEELTVYRGAANLLSILLMGLIFYKDRSFLGRIIFVIKIFLVLLSFDAIVFGAFWLTGWEAPAGAARNIRYYFYSVSLILLVLCTYRFFRPFVVGTNLEKGPLFDLILILACVVEGMPILWMDDYVHSINPNGDGYIIVYLILILIFDAALIYVFRRIKRQYRQEQDLMLLKQHQDYQQNYYKAVEAQYQRSREFVHDMQNHVMILSRLYAQDEVERAQRYGESVLQKIPEAPNERH